MLEADLCLAILGLDLTGLPSPGLILTHHLWDDIPTWPQHTLITMAISDNLWVCLTLGSLEDRYGLGMGEGHKCISVICEF